MGTHTSTHRRNGGAAHPRAAHPSTYGHPQVSERASGVLPFCDDRAVSVDKREETQRRMR